MHTYTLPFQNFLVAIVSGSERSKSQTTLLFVIDIEVVVTASYGCSVFKGELGLTVQFLLEFFAGWVAIKLSIQKRSHSETKAAILEELCFKKSLPPCMI